MSNYNTPSYFTEEEVKEFISIVNTIDEEDKLTPIDKDLITMFIDSRREYMKVIKSMKRLCHSETEKHLNLVIAKNALYDECRLLAADLGLKTNEKLELLLPMKNT